MTDIAGRYGGVVVILSGRYSGFLLYNQKPYDETKQIAQ